MHRIPLPNRTVLVFCAVLALCFRGAFAAKVQPPTFTPEGGTYFDFIEVSLASATAGATIYYTTDGSDPTVNTGDVFDPEFPIFIEEDTLVKAFAVVGEAQSEIVSASYSVLPLPPPTLKVTGPKVLKTKKPSVTIRGTSSNAIEVDYELNGSGIYGVAKGVSSWSFKAKLKPGRNVISVYAIGEYEDSNPVTIKVTYTKKKK